MVNTDFINGFQKVAVSSKLVRSAYTKALKKLDMAMKKSLVDAGEVRKLKGQTEFFSRGLDKQLKKEIPTKKKVGYSSNVKSIVSGRERSLLSSSDVKKLVG
jgi:hypothetical protein